MKDYKNLENKENSHIYYIIDGLGVFVFSLFIYLILILMFSL